MKTQRSGFTLVELLVVITIIGILMGLLIPAVNAARETARRNQCSTQVKNLALAAIQHENTKGELPGWIQKFGEFGDSITTPGSLDPALDPSDPGESVNGHVKVGTWAVALLPWLDAQPSYEHWTEDRYPIITIAGGEHDPIDNGYHPLAGTNLAIFQCPSNPVSKGDSGLNSYVTNNGVVPVALGGSTALDIDFPDSQERSNGAFNSKYAGAAGTAVGPQMRLDDFKDGQGNTILFSENVQALPWHRAGQINSTALETVTLVGTEFFTAYPVSSRYVHGMVWHYEDIDPTASIPWNPKVNATTGPGSVSGYHRINGGGDTVSFETFSLTMAEALGNTAPSSPTNPLASDIARPSSAHVDGVNAGMADGGTRFIPASINYRVYQALMTPRGKSSLVPWPEFILDGDAI